MSAEIGIRITGDSKDFEAALARSGAAADAFGRKVGDGLGGIAPKTQQATAAAAGLRETLISFAVGGTILGAFSVVASQVGQVASALLEAQIQADRLGNSLKFTFGQAGAARETAYLRDVTRELGQEYLTSAQSYGKLAAASRGTNLEGKATRDIFEAIAGASTVMGLSVEQSNGALQAITQIISKGTVQSEELRGQLGERLPGAFQIAARAMGVTTAELGKMLEQGQVISEDFLPKFAAQLKKELGDSTAESANSAQAAVNNLSSSWGLAKEELAKAGLGEFIKGQLNILTDGFDNVSQSVRQSREEGDGFFGLVAAGGGALLQFLNPLNAVSFGASTTAGKLTQAKERLAELQASLESPNAGNATFLRPAIKETEELIARLETAKQAQKELANPPASQGDVRSAEIRQQQINAEQAAKRELAAGSYLKKYATDAEKLAAELRKAKTELGEFFSPDIERRIRASFNKKNLSEPFIAGRDAAKAYADAVGDFQKIQASAEGKTNDLSKAQERLVEYLKSAVYAQHSESMRNVVLQAAYAAINAEQAADAYKDFNKALAESDAARLKSLSAGDEANEKLQEQNKALHEEIELIGLSETQQLAVLRARNESTIALKEERLARLQALDIGREEQVQLAEEIRQLKERNTLQGVKVDRAEAASALEAMNAESKRFYEDLERGLTDSLFRAFEAGRGFFSTLWDGIKNLFKTTVLKLAIQGVVGSVLGSVGLSSAAQTVASTAGSGSNLLSTASNAYSLANIGSTFASTAGALGGVAGAEFAANFIGAVGGDAIGALATGLQASGAVAGSAFASAALAAVPYVAVAGVVASALGLFRSKKIVDGGLQGELGGQINDYALQRRGGSLFSGPSYSVLDQGVSAQNDELQKAYSAIRSTVAGMAEQLGIGNDAIKAFTVQLGNDLIHPDTGGFGIKTQGLSQDEILKKIEAALQSANEQLAAFALGTTEFTRDGETAVQTLGRLTGSLGSVNSVFKTLGLTLADASLAGADAASKFVDSFGGADQFAQVASSYYQNFYTDAERTANTVEALRQRFFELGTAGATTREGFRALVEETVRLNGATSPVVAELLKLESTFASVVPAVEQATQALAEIDNVTLKVAASERRALVDSRRAAEAAAIDLQQQEKALTEQRVAEAAQIKQALAKPFQAAALGFIAGASNAEREQLLGRLGAAVGDGVANALGANFVGALIETARNDLTTGGSGLRGTERLRFETLRDANTSQATANLKMAAQSLQYALDGGTISARQFDAAARGLTGGFASGKSGAEALQLALLDVLDNYIDPLTQATMRFGNVQRAITENFDTLSEYVRVLNAEVSDAAPAMDTITASIKSFTDASSTFGDAAKELLKTAQSAVDATAPAFDATGRSVNPYGGFRTGDDQAAKALLDSLATNAKYQASLAVGQAAELLSGIVTTPTAARAQNQLGGLGLFDEGQLRDISLLVKDVAQFDTEGLTRAFYTLSDALGAGRISVEQYNALIEYSKDVYLGAADSANSLNQKIEYSKDVYLGAADSASALSEKLTGLNDALRKSVAEQQAALQKTTAKQISTIQAASEARITALQAEASRVSGNVGALRSLFGQLESAQRAATVATSESTLAIQAQARATLQSALFSANAGGSLLNFPGLEEAIGNAGIQTPELFRTFGDFLASQDATASLIGEVKDRAGSQLSVAEMTLKALEDSIVNDRQLAQDQIKAIQDAAAVQAEQLQGLLDASAMALEIANGTFTATLSVTDAVNNLNTGLQGAVASVAASNSEQFAGLLATISSFASSATNVSAFASGGVFTNGIVSQPTMAPMALFGEAGSEAIVPLAQGPGGLGIRSYGGDQIAKLEAQIDRLNAQVAELVAINKETMKSSKQTSTAVTGAFGPDGGMPQLVEVVTP